MITLFDVIEQKEQQFQQLTGVESYPAKQKLVSEIDILVTASVVLIDSLHEVALKENSQLNDAIIGVSIGSIPAIIRGLRQIRKITSLDTVQVKRLAKRLYELSIKEEQS